MEIISKQEAIKQGLKKYFTGKPCIHGHIAERYVTKSDCLVCAKQRASINKLRYKKPGIKRDKNHDNWEGVRWIDAFNNDLAYYEGKICSRCGSTKRLTNDSSCIDCGKKIRASGRYEETRKKWCKRNKIDIARKNKVRREVNKDRLKKRSEEYYKENKHRNAKFENFKNKLTVDELPVLAPDGESLMVKCANCGKYFIPEHYSTSKRCASLDGLRSGESKLYCSDECKRSCSVYGQKDYPNGFKTYKNQRPGQAQWREMVLERDNHTCQICGKYSPDGKGLVAHHMLPVSHNPIESMDIDIGITLCDDCDRMVHKLPGCRPSDLRCKK